MIAVYIALNGVRLTLKGSRGHLLGLHRPADHGHVLRRPVQAATGLDSSCRGIVNADATDTVARSITETLEGDGVVMQHSAALTRGRTTLLVPAGAASALAAAQPLNLELHHGAEDTRADANLRFKVFKALVASAIGVKPTDPAGPPGHRARTSDAAREDAAGHRRLLPAVRPQLHGDVRVPEPARLGRRHCGRAKAGTLETARHGADRASRHHARQSARALLHRLDPRSHGSRSRAGYCFPSSGRSTAGSCLALFSLFALACASLGVFFGTLFTDPDKCRGVAIWTAILLAPLGGLW